MTAYKDVDLINETISYIPDDWGCYVHIDKKSSIKEEDIDKKAFVEKQFKIYWGGVEHLKAFLLLMNMAYKSGKDYDYYHLITGQDFFATKPSDFDNILGKEQYSYIQYFKCPKQSWKAWGGGYYILKYRTFASYADIRLKPWNYLNKLFFLCQKLFSLGRMLPNYSIFGGCVYMSLTREAVKEVLYNPIAADLLKRLSNSTNAEEIYMQTILMNSPCNKRIVNNNLRYIDWMTQPAPKVLSDEDYEKVVQSRTLFCRKIDSTISKGILDKLREKMLH